MFGARGNSKTIFLGVGQWSHCVWLIIFIWRKQSTHLSIGNSGGRQWVGCWMYS